MSFLNQLRSLTMKRSIRKASSRLGVIEQLDPADMKQELNTAREKIIDLETIVAEHETRITKLEGPS